MTASYKKGRLIAHLTVIIHLIAILSPAVLSLLVAFSCQLGQQAVSAQSLSSVRLSNHLLFSSCAGRILLNAPFGRPPQKQTACRLSGQICQTRIASRPAALIRDKDAHL